jgi:aminomethyltransferase
MTNDFTKLKDGSARYTLMCNEDGGVIDDILIYRYSQEKFLAVVNAANREKDFAWIESHLTGDATADDISDCIAQIALQGPRSRDILLKLMDVEKIPEKYYTFTDEAEVGGVRCLVSQTGYTGELGYELYLSSKDAQNLWIALEDAGREYGLVPAGLGARDTLRLEAGMPLYGHEMDETVTPFEAGLSFAVKMSKEDFIGKAALERKGDPTRIRVGLNVTGRGIARGNETVYIDGAKIGRTTSGTHCPYIDHPVAMASLDVSRAASGTKVEIDVRGRFVAAEVIPLPFYTRKK